ncbi:MAG TPA: hypothetical protein VF884_03085 [Nitrososphaeraceae archaeon]
MTMILKIYLKDILERNDVLDINHMGKRIKTSNKYKNNIENLGLICICGHGRGHYRGRDHRESEVCACTKFILDKKRNLKDKMNIQGKISRECYYKFRNLIMLRHGFAPGSISFELERALRLYMGEKVLDVFVDEKDWQEYNK